jgi:hypothetical protein
MVICDRNSCKNGVRSCGFKLTVVLQCYMTGIFIANSARLLCWVASHIHIYAITYYLTVVLNVETYDH